MKQIRPNKTIGIIGGLGPQASSRLYERILSQCCQKFGAINDQDFPQILPFSVSMPDFVAKKPEKNKFPKELVKAIKILNQAQVDFFAVACNTAHLFEKEFKKRSKAKMISLIDAVVQRVIKSKIKKVGILASPLTIKSGLYRKILEAKGIQVIPLSSFQINQLERIIRAVIAQKVNPGVKNDLQELIGCLFKKGAQGVILGCTELPLLIDGNRSSRLFFDSLEILAEELVDRYYQ